MFAKKHLTSSLLAFHFVFCRSVCVCECLSECKRNEIRFALVLFRQKIIELRGPVSLCVRSFLVATLRIRGARFSPVSVVGLVWAGGSRPKWALNVVCAVSGAAAGSVSLGPSEEWRGRGESCPHAEGYPLGTGGDRVTRRCELLSWPSRIAGAWCSGKSRVLRFPHSSAFPFFPFGVLPAHIASRCCVVAQRRWARPSPWLLEGPCG